MQRQSCAFVLVLVCLSCASNAAGQGGLGAITGTAIDQTNASLPGADIKVVEKTTGAT